MKRQNLDTIRQKLELQAKEIANLPKERGANLTYDGFDIDDLVQEVRQKTCASIIMRCGMMRLLGVSQPIGLHDIYTNVNILEQISGRRRLGIADLIEVCVSDEFERPGLGRIFEPRVPGLEVVKQYSKLMVLGKPGSGKTTFLKYVAIQCSLGEFQANRVPVFITLKDLSETEQQPSLLEYITGQFAIYGVADNTVAELLSQGRMLVLLDGLDEVKEIDIYRIVQEVRNFTTQFPANYLVVTCRIAAREYTFEQFTEVEVADFDDEQIATFATKWFATKDPIKSKKFITKLKVNNPIQELANNPLLLTLLCLIFEESADFPANRSELYEEGLDILLKKWDAKRNIERYQVYKELSVQHKKHLLSNIALITFERGDYFFIQKELEQYIVDYIQHLLNAKTDLEALQLDSEAVLKSIEAQHGLLVERARGIYSFSHLTFQEYFTAKEIVACSNPQDLEQGLKQLATRITEKRWREVFLLTTSLLSNAGYLLQLIKQQIDNLIVQDKYLQKFLTWLSQKARSAIGISTVAVRAFYLDVSLGLDLRLNPALSLALKLDPTLGLALKRDLELDLELNFALNLTRSFDYTLGRTLECSLASSVGLCLDRELRQSLQLLKDKLPNPNESEESFKKWWKVNGRAWTEQLRFVQIKYRDIGHDWQFSQEQRRALKHYHDANMLLLDCLKSGCYTTHAVREELEETLLLPFTEIEQRK